MCGGEGVRVWRSSRDVAVGAADGFLMKSGADGAENDVVIVDGGVVVINL